MQKQYFTLILAVAISFFSKAQINSVPENPHDCGQHTQQEKIYELYPEQRLQDSIDGVQFEQEYQNYLANYDPNQRSTYTVPIVVHVVHLNGEGNISNNQIYNAIEKLNEDFSMSNSDLSNTYPAFTGIIGNGDIEFKLATKDPNGNCHSGITRTFSGTSYDTGMSGGGHPIVDAVATQHGIWPQNQYMSIFVCLDPSGNAGYTNYPSNWFDPNEMYGAIFMRHDYMGEIGTSTSSRKHVLSHEAGHWLNLAHVWGSTNSPNIPSNCNSDDNVADTPNSLGSQGCLPTTASCGSIDNIQNIMEYSACRTMFTQGQAARMHTALNSNTGGRSNLITSFNLAATGVDLPAPICKADFIPSEKVICAGETISFTDMSFHSITGRTWNFTGGSPSTSADSVVSVTYNSPGTYAVSIDATDGTTNIIETKTDYIVVMPNDGLSLPIQENFETIVFPDNDKFFSSVSFSGIDWEISTSSASLGTRSIFYNNYSNGTEGAVVSFESGTIDLSNLDPAEDLIFTFDYAYRKQSTGDDEWLRVFVSKDCGETWLQRKVMHGSILGSGTSGVNFIAASDDYRTIELTNINSSYYVSNFRYKFVFESDGGNNIFIDNINIVGEESLDINENSGLSTIEMYPNPVTSELSVFIGDQAVDSYRIVNASGQVISVRAQPIVNSNRVLTINTDQFAKGIYYISFISESSIITEKFIKQ